MLAAVVLTTILLIILTAIGANAAKNAATRAYKRGYQEAKALYNTGHFEVWENAAADVLRWFNDGLPSDSKPKNPYKNP